MEALLPKVDKVLGMCQTNENFTVGDKMTFADVYIFAIRLFVEDPLLNNYTDFKRAMTPKAVKINIGSKLSRKITPEDNSVSDVVFRVIFDNFFDFVSYRR